MSVKIYITIVFAVNRITSYNVQQEVIFYEVSLYHFALLVRVHMLKAYLYICYLVSCVGDILMLCTRYNLQL